MEITGKILLNSAEKIIGNQKEQSKRAESKNITANVDQARSTAQSRLVGMQADLSETQKLFSKEQARLQILQSNDDPLTGKTAAGMTFDGKPLFPELNQDWPQDPTQRPELIRTVEESLTQARARLKSLQVEMENHLAVEFSAAAKMSEPGELSFADAKTSLDPQRVARLTRPQA